MKKVDLIADQIEFTPFSIVYKVRPSEELCSEHPVFCPDDIGGKDLILKPTLISNKNLSVIYTPSNVIPHFYQSIIEETIHDILEHKADLEKIYVKGDVVGHVLVNY